MSFNQRSAIALRTRKKHFIAVFAVLAAASFAVLQSGADVVGFEDFDGGDINLTGAANVFDYNAGGGSLGDVFGRVSNFSNGGTGMPFDVADDTVQSVSGGTVSASDALGIAGQNTSAFFALADADGSAGPGLPDATWTFDISSAISITDISIDLAAMGDFEFSSQDGFRIEAQIDGGGYQTMFLATSDDSANKTYRAMDGGATPNLNDPLELFIDGAGTSVGFLDKADAVTGAFDTYQSVLFAGQSGLSLDVRVSWAGTPSGGEPQGVDNITINAVVPEPGTLSLLLLGLLARFRFRRK
jgi:hypothetical protein